MALEFYMLPFSPPCRPVWMTLEALGLKYEERITNVLTGENKTAEYAKINPSQKIPGLKDGDFTLGESRAIAGYLCTQHGGKNKSLYPQDAKTRAKVDMHLYMDVSLQQKIQNYVNIPGVFFRGEKTSTDKVGEVKEVLQAYENLLGKNKYIACDQLTIADFFAYVTIGLLEITDFDDYSAYPRVVAWKKTMAELPYHKKTCVDPLGQFREMYRSKLQ